MPAVVYITTESRTQSEDEEDIQDDKSDKNNKDQIKIAILGRPNYYTFCFDDFETENKELYKDKECKSSKLGSAQIMNGVVKGVNVGGNCSGIPTPQGGPSSLRL